MRTGGERELFWLDQAETAIAGGIGDALEQSPGHQNIHDSRTRAIYAVHGLHAPDY
jgi:hypothetical protein